MPVQGIWRKRCSGAAREIHGRTQHKEEIIRAYQERSSMSGIQRIYEVSITTLSKCLKSFNSFKLPIKKADT